MKKLFKLTFFFSFLMLFVACGDDDLEPTLAQDKDLNTGINNACLLYTSDSADEDYSVDLD